LPHLSTNIGFFVGKKGYLRKDLLLQKSTTWSLTALCTHLYKQNGYKMHVMLFDVAIALTIWCNA
jgi:diacylglycerol kinase